MLTSTGNDPILWVKDGDKPIEHFPPGPDRPHLQDKHIQEMVAEMQPSPHTEKRQGMIVYRYKRIGREPDYHRANYEGDCPESGMRVANPDKEAVRRNMERWANA
jgi:hypothetical protein